MKVIFTTTDLLSSKIIRWVTGEDISHCALESGNYVLHSSFSGTIIEYKTDFYERNQVLYEINMPEIATINFKERRGYDFGAILYLGLKLALAKVGIKLPKKNLWQTTGMYLCTEFITEVLDEKENSMITPYKLYLKLKESQETQK